MSNKPIFLLIIGSIFICLLMISLSIKPSSIYDFYGSWKGQYSNKEVFMKFSNDGTCLLLIKEIGSEITETIEGDFTIDISKDPMPLSISNISQLNHPLHTIVSFLGADSLMIGTFAPSWKVRGISFNNSQNFTLTRTN